MSRVSRSTKYEPPSGSTTSGDAALVGDDLLRAQRERRRLGGRQRQRLVERVGVERVGAAEHRRQRLQRRPDDVVVRLLRGQRHAGRLAVEAQLPRSLASWRRTGRACARAQSVRAARYLAISSKKSLWALKKNDMRGTKSSTSSPASTPHCTYSRPSRSVNASSCSAVAPASRMWYPLTEIVFHRGTSSRAEREDVGDEPHRRTRRKDVFLLGDELLEDVVLNRARQRLPAGALLLGDDQVHREDHRRRRVDRHRRRDVAERNAVEQRLHVGERRDVDAALPHFAERQRVIRIAAHQRRQVERDAQAGAAGREQRLVAAVGLLRRAEPGKLPHRPELAAIAGGVDAARVGKLAGRAGIDAGDVVGGVERLDRPAGDRRERLRALGRGLLRRLHGFIISTSAASSRERLRRRERSSASRERRASRLQWTISPSTTSSSGSSKCGRSSAAPRGSPRPAPRSARASLRRATAAASPAACATPARDRTAAPDSARKSSCLIMPRPSRHSHDVRRPPRDDVLGSTTGPRPWRASWSTHGSIFGAMLQEFDGAARLLNLEPGIWKILTHPKRQITVSCPGPDGQRRDRSLHRLPRAVQHHARPGEGRHPLSPGRHARRGDGAGRLDDVEVRRRAHPVRRRQGRRHLRSDADVAARARGADAPLRRRDHRRHRSREGRAGARRQHQRAGDGVGDGHLQHARRPHRNRRSSPASRSSSAARSAAARRPAAA